MGSSGGSSKDTARTFQNLSNALTQSQSRINQIASATPIQTPQPVSAVDLGQQGIDLARLNALASKSLEREISPDVAKVRGDLARDIAGRDEMLEDLIQREAVRAGLTDALSSGFTQIAPGSVAQSNILKVLGKDIIDHDTQQKLLAMQFLQQNPQAQIGIDPETGLATELMQEQNILSTRNQNARDLRDLAIQQAGERFGLTQSGLLAALQQKQKDEQAEQARLGQILGIAGPAAGLAASFIPGVGPLLGPMISLGGKAAASRVPGAIPDSFSLDDINLNYQSGL